MLLHAEIGRLPERFRAAVVLCYFEGRTYEDAARVLRCPVGTIKSRLATARERLRRRLDHLTLTPAAGSADLVLLANPPIIPFPVPLPESTLQTVIRHATGGKAPASITYLAQQVLNSMLWHRAMYRIAAACAALLCAAALATGAMGLRQTSDELRADGEQNVAGPAASAVQPPPTPHDDRASRRTPPIRNGLPITLTGRIVDER
jgi:hypothetical protein